MGRELGKVSSEQLWDTLRVRMFNSLCSFSGACLPGPKWAGCSNLKKPHRLGETYVQYGPLFFFWGVQNLSQTLVLAGVTVKKGQEQVNIYCPIVISDAGLFNTYQYLLPESARCLPGKRPGQG